MHRVILFVTILFVLMGACKTSGPQVYICKSPKAYAYHYNQSCRGLNRCTYEIVKVSLKSAVNKHERSLCGYED